MKCDVMNYDFAELGSVCMLRVEERNSDACHRGLLGHPITNRLYHLFESLHTLRLTLKGVGAITYSSWIPLRWSIRMFGVERSVDS